MITQTGQAGPHQKEDELEWDERNGPVRTLIFEGVAAEIDGLVPTYQAPGYRYSRRSMGGGLFQLRVSAANAMDGTSPTADAAVQVDWELDGSDYEISIYKRMVQRSVPEHLATFIERVAARLKAASDTSFPLALAVAEVRAEATDVSPTFDADYAEGWLLLVVAGVESHRVSNFVVRKTLVAPNAWVSGATLNVGLLYTWAQLIAEHAGFGPVPSGISAEMPAGGYYLKGTPRRRTQGNGKIQITQDWQHSDTFSTLQYDVVT